MLILRDVPNLENSDFWVHQSVYDDEAVIGKERKKGHAIIFVATVIFGVALTYGSTKSAILFGFIAIMVLLNEAVNYLFDIAIRLSRTNDYLSMEMTNDAPENSPNH